MTRRAVFIGVAILVGALASLLLAEAAARVYAYAVAERGKLFEPDARVGWKNLAHLDLRRRNVDGEPWHIRTNSRGERSDAETFDAAASRRILVLGDSFAFGEGIDLRERFDTRIAAAHPEWSFVNQGVMGYGTDQQLLAAAERLSELRAGDVVVLLTHVSDFVDLLMPFHSGRQKPWFELVEGQLLEHPPALSAASWLRDQSYLLARLFQALADDPELLPAARIRQSEHLYRHIVLAKTADARARGVRVLIAYHGLPPLGGAVDGLIARVIGEALRRVCGEPGITCLALDGVLTPNAGPKLLQSDSHWNADGHAVVEGALRMALEGL
jgi:hypothetical protein